MGDVLFAPWPATVYESEDAVLDQLAARNTIEDLEKERQKYLWLKPACFEQWRARIDEHETRTGERPRELLVTKEEWAEWWKYESFYWMRQYSGGVPFNDVVLRAFTWPPSQIWNFDGIPVVAAPE